jgi:hypothetical protein
MVCDANQTCFKYTSHDFILVTSSLELRQTCKTHHHRINPSAGDRALLAYTQTKNTLAVGRPIKWHDGSTCDVASIMFVVFIMVDYYFRLSLALI